MIHDLVAAEYRGGYCIELGFDDGKRGVLDFTPYMEKGGIFQRLRDPDFFKRFRVDPELGVLSWEGLIDIAPETLYSEATGTPLPEWMYDDVSPPRARQVMQLNWLELLGLSVGLAMDAFAVAVAVGLSVKSVTPRHVFRLGFHFGLFQFLMPIVGWFVGDRVADSLGTCDHWVAFFLLAYVGGKMLWDAHSEKKAEATGDPTRGVSLLTLSVATSLDALAVGMSMALLGVSVWIPSVVIGVVTATLTAIGIAFGGRIGPRWERWADTAGGIVLILIGLKVLLAM